MPMTDTKEPSRNEHIKEASQYLRGTLAEGLREEITGAIIEDDAQLVKFHGMYLQDDRDLRAERGKKKMEKAFAFMIRLRIPGGVCTPQQFLQVQHIAQHPNAEKSRALLVTITLLSSAACAATITTDGDGNLLSFQPHQ